MGNLDILKDFGIPVNPHLDQLNRIRRWKRRLDEIRFSNSSEDRIPHQIDFIYAFFTNCYHLRDFLEYFMYLFSWDEVSENDNGRLIEFLKQTYDVDIEKTAKIDKIDEGKEIRVVSITNDTISLRLNKKPDKRPSRAELTNNCRKIDEFIAKTEDGKINIYDSKINQLNQFFKTNIEMQICRDICNESKHCSLEYPAIGVKILNTNKKSAEGLAGVCIVKEYDPFQEVLKNTNPIKNIKYVVLAEGKKYDVFELADEIVGLPPQFL